MTKLARTLKLVCVAGVIAAGCGSGGDAPNDAGRTTGTGGSASGTGGSVGSGGSGGSADASAGGSGGGAGATGTGGSGGAAGMTGSGGTVVIDGGGGVGMDGGGPADNWDNFAKGFFTSFCVSCHNDDNSGTATRDYHMMANVVKEKVLIGCGVAKSAADATARGCAAGSPRPKQFPVGNGAKPTDPERDRLLRWIDAGTP
jgi:hypothetical protein